VGSATPEDHAVFASWRERDRLEEQTCRPVVEGRRVATVAEPVVLAFHVAGIDGPVGRFAYSDVNSRNRSAEIGYVVAPHLRGRGLGARMLAVAIDHVFATTALDKLHAQTAAFNTASVRLLERLGFHRDGTLREHHELDGRMWDDHVYSLLRREWRRGARRGGGKGARKRTSGRRRAR
jgi:RimJ/RimL family protein N-acetyltransferase